MAGESPNNIANSEFQAFTCSYQFLNDLKKFLTTLTVHLVPVTTSNSSQFEVSGMAGESPAIVSHVCKNNFPLYLLGLNTTMYSLTILKWKVNPNETFFCWHFLALRCFYMSNKTVSKFARHRFSQRTNEFGFFAMKSKKAKKPFICSFFGRLYGTPICLRFLKGREYVTGF